MAIKRTLLILAYILIGVGFTNEQYIQISSDLYYQWKFKFKCDVFLTEFFFFFFFQASCLPLSTTICFHCQQTLFSLSINRCLGENASDLTLLNYSLSFECWLGPKAEIVLILKHIKPQNGPKLFFFMSDHVYERAAAASDSSWWDNIHSGGDAQHWRWERDDPH